MTARRVGLIISLLLLAGAVIVVWSRRDVVLDAVSAVSRPAALPLSVLLIAVALNVVLSGVMFSLLMSRYGRVGKLEMQAVMAATTLVNFLPLRPGLLGRVAYHKSCNKIAVADSARTIIQGAALSVAVAGYASFIAVLAMRFGLNLTAAAVVPFPILALLSAVASLRIWCWAAMVRYVEVLIWALRYWAAFSLLDLPIGPDSALALACVSVIVTMVPFVSNGLGLREWAIGLVSPLLTSYQLSLGLTAELLNRAAELVVVLVLGVCAMAYLTRLRRVGAHGSADRA